MKKVTSVLPRGQSNRGFGRINNRSDTNTNVNSGSSDGVDAKPNANTKKIVKILRREPLKETKPEVTDTIVTDTPMMSTNKALMQKFASTPKVSSLPNSKGVFELLGVGPEEDENLRILDTRGNLILVHYLNATIKTSGVRGVVIDTVKMKVVCNSFPATEEHIFSSLNHEQIQNIDFSTVEVTKAYEGTIVRLFHTSEETCPSTCMIETDESGETDRQNNEKVPVKGWVLSTHKKIDGRRSRWEGPETFGKQFIKAWTGSDENKKLNLNKTLRKDYCYVFLLSSPNNRIVCDINAYALRLVAVYVPSFSDRLVRLSLSSIYPTDTDTSNLPFTIQRTLPIKSYDEFCENAKSIDWKECTGLLVCRGTERIVCFKVVPDAYAAKRDIRGNEPNLRLRYVYMYKRGKARELMDLYPEKTSVFQELNQKIRLLPKQLVDTYRSRYMKNRNADSTNEVKLPQEVYYVISSTYNNFHPGYSLSSNIRYYLDGSNARQVYAMIRHFENEERDHNIPNAESQESVDK